VVASDRHDRLAGAWRVAAATGDTLLGSAICAGLQMAGGDDLVLRPDSEGEGAWTVAKHDVQAIVGPLERRNRAAAVHPDKEGSEEVSRQLVWQQAACVVFARQSKSRNIYDF
jgi:hypothetical protein